MTSRVGFRAALAASLALGTAGCAGGSDKGSREATPAPAAESACAAGWPGPWAACPEADWIRRVVREAGYDVAGDTGSAVVARGQGASFFIWSTPAQDVAERERRAWPLLRREGGAAIYGDRVRQWWIAGAEVVWIEAGPTGDARLPQADGFERLVAASGRLPLP